MSRWAIFDKIGDKIIELLNKMSGISTMLAALFATVIIGAKKNIMHPMLYIMILASLLLTIITFRGYLRGITSIISKDEFYGNSKKWIVFSYLTAGLMSFIPYAAIIVITHSLL